MYDVWWVPRIFPHDDHHASSGALGYSHDLSNLHSFMLSEIHPRTLSIDMLISRKSTLR